MPTIFINTNLSKNLSNSSDQTTNDDSNGTSSSSSNSSSDLDADFRQDLNMIITKLLNKSKTLDSFMIKYDLEDLISTNKTNMNEKENLQMNQNQQTSSKKTNCICYRMARLFNDILKTTDSNENDNITITTSNNNSTTNNSNSNDLKFIYKELKVMRKFQTDLSTKFNLIMKKLDDNNNNNNNNNKNNSNLNLNNSVKISTSRINNSPTFLTNKSRFESHMNISNHSTIKQQMIQNLTGAKKRKFNNSFNTLKTNSILKTDNDLINNDDIDNQISIYETETKSPVRSASVSSNTSSTSTRTSLQSTNNNLINSTNQTNAQSDQDNESIYIKVNDDNQDSNLEQNDDDDDLIFDNNSINVNQKNHRDDEYEDENLDADVEHVTDDFQNDLNPNTHHQNAHIYNLHQNLQNHNSYISNFTHNRPTTSRIANINNYSYNSINYQNKFLPLNIQQQQQQQQKIYQPQSHSNHQSINNRIPIVTKSPISTINEQKPPILQQQQQLQHHMSTTFDIDINELLKGNGPKFLQLELYENFIAPIVFVNDKYYVDDTKAAFSYSKSKSRRNFAAHLTKLVFTPVERLESNCNGRFGKKALDSTRLLAIRNTIFKYYPCKQSTVILNGDKITSGDHDENSVWVRDCIPAIDESNRVLKKQLVAWYKKNNPNKLIRICSSSSSIGAYNNGSSMNNNNSNNNSNIYSGSNYQSSNVNHINGNLDETEYEELDEHE